MGCLNSTKRDAWVHLAAHGRRPFQYKMKTSDEIKEPEEKCVMEEEHKEQTNITMEVQEPVISENERRKRLREILRLVAQKLRQKELVNFVLRKVSYVT